MGIKFLGQGDFLSDTWDSTTDFLFGEDDIEKPEVPEKMDYEKAYNQAESILDPKFEQQQQNLSKQQVNRGFYGQMPGDVVQQELASQQESQLANQAQQIRQQQFQNDMQTYQYEMQDYNKESQGLFDNSNFWGTVGTIAGSFLGGPAGAAIGGSIGSNFGGSNNQNTGYNQNNYYRNKYTNGSY